MQRNSTSPKPRSTITSACASQRTKANVKTTPPNAQHYYCYYYYYYCSAQSIQQSHNRQGPFVDRRPCKSASCSCTAVHLRTCSNTTSNPVLIRPQQRQSPLRNIDCCDQALLHPPGLSRACSSCTTLQGSAGPAATAPGSSLYDSPAGIYFLQENQHSDHLRKAPFPSHLTTCMHLVGLPHTV